MNINEIAEILKEKYPEIEILRGDLYLKSQRKTYASQLTKEDLEKMGVTDVDFDNLIVYGNNGPFKMHKNKAGYLMINLYSIDIEGRRLKSSVVRKNGKKSYSYKTRSIGLHRILWAWKYGKVHTGKVIDHINNHHTNIEDYRLENLQEITPWENINKERAIYGTRTIKVVKNNMLDHYLNKLKKLIDDYEEAKLNHDATKCHNIRSNISICQAKIRYICEKMSEEEIRLRYSCENSEEKEEKDYF